MRKNNVERISHRGPSNVRRKSKIIVAFNQIYLHLLSKPTTEIACYGARIKDRSKTRHALKMMTNKSS